MVFIKDEPTLRLVVTEVLQDFGFRVIAADDGLTGLEPFEIDVLVRRVRDLVEAGQG